MSEDAHKQLVRLATMADTADALFDDPRWEELARGEASETTRRELEQLALEAGVPEAMDAFAPLSPAAEARILAAADDAADAPAAEEPEQPEPASQRVVAFPSRRPLLFGLAAALALAALVTLWLRQPEQRVAARWPAYELTLQGGEKAMRSDGQPRSYRPGSRLQVSLRPQRHTPQAPSVRAFLVSERAVVPLAGQTEASGSGALRFRAQLPDALPEGPLSLWLVLGRADDLPPAGADRATLDGLGASVHVMKASLPRASSGNGP